MHRYYDQINSYVESHKDEILKMWETIVNMEGHYDEKENVEKVRNFVQAQFEAEGFKCHVHEVMPERAGMLIGILGEDRPGAPVIFSGHVDTVHHTGSFGGPNPFKIEDGKAFGPGVLDMKGGVVIALYVVKALNEIGFNERPIKIVFAGEEESDHVGNDAADVFTEEARGGICAFNMETGHISNSLCVGRKTQYTVFGKVTGLGGHAGNEFTKAHNAVHETIKKCSDLMKLTDLDVGTTATVSLIDAGGNSHTSSIPDLSEFAVDIRVFSNEIGDKVLAKVDEIMKHSYDEGTTTEYHVTKANLLPFDVTPKSQQMLDLINKTAADCGLPTFGSIKLGGATDGGAIARAGVPVLCSCGVIGQYNHNRREYAVVQSMFDRIKIYAMTVTDLKEME